MVIWELRYKAPRSIENVHIETFTTEEAEAKQLADAYLQSLGTPSVRFIRLRQIVVARSGDVGYEAVAERWQPKEGASKTKRKTEDDDEELERMTAPGKAARVGA